MRFLSRLLLERHGGGLWRHCLLLWPLALAPSLALVAMAWLVFAALGIDVRLLAPPDLLPSWATFIEGVFIAPILETLLLAGVLGLLVVLSSNRLLVISASALAWGALHGNSGVMWFFGTVWSFFVFSSAYLSWREISFRHAFVAAALPHALVNLTAFGLNLLPDPFSFQQSASNKSVNTDAKSRHAAERRCSMVAGQVRR